MATSDIDTTSIVGKYLSRQTTGTRLNADGNTADENTAILESIAIAFLLNPQAVLSIVLNAKNSLQQFIGSDIEIIDYVTAAISETQNPDAIPASTADLVDAQTALVELDRIGRVDTSLQAFTRYQNSINNFLNNQLAPLVKRSPTGNFNRSGLEAKQDLFNSVGLFTQTHALFIQRLKTLAGAIANYNSVDLSKVVHTQTLARVRASLQQIKAGMDSGGMSNMVAALELMAGSASLQSISNTKKVYDDTIPLSQGLFIGPEPTSAFIESAVGPLLSTTASHPWRTSLAIDGGSATLFELPFTGRTACPYVCNSPAQATFNIPASTKLYVDVTPGPAPVSGVTHYEIPLTAGLTRSWTAVIADINAVLVPDGLLAADFATPDHAIILFGRTLDTSIEVLVTGTGSFNTSTGLFTPPDASASAILGFTPNQASVAVGSFDLPFLQRFFHTNYAIPAAITADGRLGLISPTDNPKTSSLQVAGTLMIDFGFSSAGAVPLAMQIFDTSVFDDTGVHVQDPAALGVLQGSIIHASAFIEPVASLDGTRLLFDPTLTLPLDRSALRVVAPTVAAVQVSTTILNAFSGQFDSDILPLQGLLSPLLTTPSLAQVNDALNAFRVIKTRLSSLLSQLSAVVIAESQEPADAVAQSVLQTLEERGLDSAMDLLTGCQFSDFFALTSETASKSTNFMKTIEVVGSTDLATSTIEEDLPDGNLLAGSSPTSVLTDKEVP